MFASILLIRLESCCPIYIRKPTESNTLIGTERWSVDRLFANLKNNAQPHIQSETT